MIRTLIKSDIPIIVDAFAKSNWIEKPSSLFKQYLEEQNNRKRVCWIAFSDNKFAGYVTLKWQSLYPYFAQTNTPEISDLNVLPEFRNSGVGSSLIKKCEGLAANKSNFIGVGVGFYPDYGAAQRLYIRLGYIPDGHGATYNYKYVVPGIKYPLDDNLVLWFTKKLSLITKIASKFQFL